MTPQHRLAVEIMSECGMTPHEIVADAGWCAPVTVAEVHGVLETQAAARNDNRCHFVKAFGEWRSLASWSRVSGILAATLAYRIKIGTRPEIALTTPGRPA